MELSSDSDEYNNWISYVPDFAAVLESYFEIWHISENIEHKWQIAGQRLPVLNLQYYSKCTVHWLQCLPWAKTARRFCSFVCLDFDHICTQLLEMYCVFCLLVLLYHQHFACDHKSYSSDHEPENRWKKNKKTTQSRVWKLLSTTSFLRSASQQLHRGLHLLYCQLTTNWSM